MTYFTFSWDNLDQADWEKYFNKVAFSNLFQTWAYGAATAETSSFLPKRGLILRKDKPVGMVQLFTRPRFFQQFMQHKLIRGPLWFNETNSIDQMIAIDMLHQDCRTGWRNMYSFLPECRDEVPHLTFCKNKNFIKIKPGYATVVLDLSQPEETLHKNLRPTWRHSLQKGLKNKLHICDVKPTENKTAEAIHRFCALKKRKYFTGPNAPFLEAFLIRQPFLHMQVQHEDSSLLAEGIFMVHGTTATYYMAYTSPQGRVLFANHVLLWSAVQKLKEKKINYLDMGGIEMPRSKGLTSFKKGMGGITFNTLPTYV